MWSRWQLFAENDDTTSTESRKVAMLADCQYITELLLQTEVKSERFPFSELPKRNMTQ